MLCFDNNSVTAVAPAVAQAMREAVTSGTYMCEAERAVRELLGVSDGIVLFTSGCAESLVLLCDFHAAVATSLLDPLYAVTRPNAKVSSVSAEGGLFLKEFVHHAENSEVVFMSCANEEYGVIADVQSAAELVPEGIPMVVDVTQAVGRLKLDAIPENVHAVMLDSRTCYCGPGLGVLWVRDEQLLENRFSGGFHQKGHRPWPVSEILLAGLAAGLRLILENQDRWYPEITRLRRKLDAALGYTLNFKDAPLLCNTSNYHIPDVNTKALSFALAKSGILVSDTEEGLKNTTMCTPLTTYLFAEQARHGNLRVSLSGLNTEAEVDQLIAKTRKAVSIARRFK